MATKPPELTSRFEFHQEVLQAESPVAVDFTGRNHQSQELSRTFTRLAREFDGQMRFYTVDTNEAERLDADYRVSDRRTPTVILFHRGRPVRRWKNEQNPHVYRRAFREVLEQPRAG